LFGGGGQTLFYSIQALTWNNFNSMKGENHLICVIISIPE
jgi:hypothetical protein